jgi:O-antigen ligase
VSRALVMSGAFYKIAVILLAVLGLLIGCFFVQSLTGFFNNADYLGALLLIEIVMASLWIYDIIFFPLLMAFFLWAGMNVPASSAAMTARWPVLAVAAFAGSLIWMRNRRHAYGAFHLVAFSCVGAALVSASVSADPATALLKVLSLFLLFLYGSTGARLAMLGRETRFVRGLLIGCELTVYGSAIAYLGARFPVWGNPNSLGAVMGVVIVPLLFWGMIVAETRPQRHRRLIALVLAGALLYVSLSRASILAASIAVVTLCVSLRKQRLLVQGAFLAVLFLVGSAVWDPPNFDHFVDSVTNDILHKGKPEESIWASRQTPWEETVTAIKQRPWFGTGFGTGYMGVNAADAPPHLSLTSGGVYTKESANREHGNSYLALAEYVGVLGIVPFAFLVFFVARMIFQVCLWMHMTANPYHCAIPLAMVLLAGLVHAFFEDWLTAVGYYLCVFFWTSAFLLRDNLPALRRINIPSASPVHPIVVRPFSLNQ